MQAVKYWVDVALEANRRDHTLSTGNENTGPFRSARALGMTLIAMHDAFAAVAGGMTPYHVAVGAPAGLAPGHAMASAAYKTLAGLYPNQAGVLNEAWDRFAASAGPSRPSVDFGAHVGDQVLAWRKPDEALFLGVFTPTGQPYDHDEDPLHPGQGFAGPLWGGAARFLASQQPFAVPPGHDGAGTFTPGAYYADELEEVRAFGAEVSAVRTPDQEEIGIYWGYDGAKGLGTPPRLYMQVVLTVLEGFRRAGAAWLNQRRYLEAVTAAAAAMADAGIQAWHYKYSPLHMLWRPVLGIRNAPGGVMGIEADSTWRPLGAPQTNQTDLGRLAATPNFPAYPSGHATFGAACFEILRRFVRHHDAAISFTDDEEDPIAFDFVSDEFNGLNPDLRPGSPRPCRPRHYASLWRAIVDNSESRIWLGVHWRFDGISVKLADGSSAHGSPGTPGDLGEHGGVRLGMDIAKDIATQRGFA